MLIMMITRDYHERCSGAKDGGSPACRHLRVTGVFPMLDRTSTWTFSPVAEFHVFILASGLSKYVSLDVC
jgi:hypothetical protein